MSLKNETEEHINFISDKVKSAQSRFFDFCENIGEKVLNLFKIKKHTKQPAKEISAYGKSVRALWREFGRSILSTAFSAVLVIAICTVTNLLGWSLGYEVIIDGENIGMVTDKSVVCDAISETRDEIKLYLGDEAYEKEAAFVRRIVDKDSLSSKDDLKRALLSNVDMMVEGYGVYIDGKLTIGVSSMDAAEWVLASYKKKFVGEDIAEDMSVDFCESIDIKKEFLHIAVLNTPEEALETLSGDTKELTSYTVKENDSLWNIAKKYDTSVEHILAMNEEITENIKEGMVIKVEEAVPLLSVRTMQTVSQVEPVPYPVEKIKDDSIYEGRTTVKQKGVDGSAKVLARVTKINGVEVKRDVLESEITSEPISQIEKIGTKKRPPTTGSGTFMSPTFGTLSSRYGGRWGRQHTGIDIAGSYNSDIKAADGGIVTYAGWMSGYGNYIIIDHENGYQTGYGHCASLCVGEGDRVAKGDIIAKMGNTGRSTGTHLHFEVKKNGEYVNPLNYVGY